METVDDVQAALAAHDYLADEGLADVDPSFADNEGIEAQAGEPDFDL